MQTYLILRRAGWATTQDLTATAARSAAEGDQMPDDIRWISSYVIGETDGSLGTVCINLMGGLGRNIVTGDDRANRLEGGPSFDIVTSIDGIGGNDVIIGHSAAGADVCQGDAGPPPDSVHCP